MLSRQNQKGRSMIEMLGVLGIMAVITVLGITAYTMATRNVKSNNIKAEVATIAQQVRTMTQPSEFSEWDGSTRDYESAFVDTGLMKEYNGMGVSDGYEIIGEDNVGFAIVINLDDDEDAALVYSMDWSNASAVQCVGTAPTSITTIPTSDDSCASNEQEIVIYYNN
ncbi:MAG: type II secretion system GspH family protein [Alphaproteobacteria bacterium]|nr:type II secretion system GspH family protein [Alphaproteobacteria bacterium]